jgi:hypothetical protein
MEIDFIKGKKRPPGKKRIVGIKFSGEELVLLRAKSMQFTGGCVSDWVRYASLKLLPLVEHINLDSTTDPELLKLYGESREEGSWRDDAIRKELASFKRMFNQMENK